MKYKKQVVVISILIMLIFNFTSVFALENKKGENLLGDYKNVLCIASYHQGFKWSDEIIDSIKEKILGNNSNINLIIDYMDVMRNKDKEFLEWQSDSFYNKYKNQKIDAIIVVNDPAFDVIVKNRDRVFKNIPIIFTALNRSNRPMALQLDNVTGVYEGVQVESTINLGYRFDPNLENVIFINDDENGYRNNITLPEGVNSINIDESDIYKVIKEINQYGNNSMVIPSGTLYKDGIFVDEIKAVEYISKHINIPMYTLWAYQLGHGVVGGDIITGAMQGNYAANMVLDVLNGTDVNDIPEKSLDDKVYDEENSIYVKREYSTPITSTYRNAQYIVDGDMLKKFNFKNKDLDSNFIVINSLIGNPWGEKRIELFLLLGIVLVLIYLIIIYANKNQREELEQDFYDKTERLSVLINSTPDLITFKDGDGRWLECNNSAKEMLTLKSDEDYLMRTNLELAERDKDRAAYYRHFEKTDNIAWMSKEIFKSESIIPDKYGIDKIYETVKVPLFTKEGKRKALVVLGRDITSRRLSQKKLEQSEKRYENLINTLPGAIIMYLNDTIIFANKTAVDMLGAKSYKALVGRSLQDIFYGSFDRRYLFDKLKCLDHKDGNVLTVEETLAKFNGKKIEASLSFMSFMEDERITTAVLITDITEANRAKELQRKIDENSKLLFEAREYDRIKTEFFSNISHELRTPINVMFSSVQLLELYNSNGKIKDETGTLDKRLHVLKQNSYRLLRLVNNLIDITRIDSGFLTLNLVNRNIIEVIEEITMSVADYIEDKGLELIFDTNTEETIMAFDPEKIERIILNLLANSVKFTDRGGKIFVNVTEKQSKLEISIKDTGIGIPKDKLEVIFDRFRQVDKSLTRAKEGSGIGLSLVKSLVNMHGGKITVSSVLGKGSEFIITLPIRLDGDELDPNIINSDEDRVQKIGVEFSDIYT